MLADLNYDKPSVLEPYSPSGNYGFFGYRGAMCDRAIRADNVQALVECVEREFIDSDSTDMLGNSMVKHCERHGAVKCATMLRERGWN
jgi:hypothetical protein